MIIDVIHKEVGGDSWRLTVRPNVSILVYISLTVAQ